MKYRLSLRPFVADLALGVIGGAALWVAVAYAGSASADKRPAGRAATPASAAPADQAIRNRILLAFLRMPGARPATIHATPNVGILHAAIEDAVNTHRFLRPVSANARHSRASRATAKGADGRNGVGT